MSDEDDFDIDNDLDIDQFDDGDDTGGGFDDFTEKGTLADLWKNNPMVKVGVILAVFVVIVAGVILFGGGEEKAAPSRTVRSSDLTEAPGTAEVSESYRQAIEEENTRLAELALQESKSAIPMPVEPPKGTIALQVDNADEEDPLDRWRRMQEERIQQQQIVAQDFSEPAPDAPPVDTRTPAVNALAQAQAIQMESVLANQQIKAPHFKKITSMSYLEAIAEKERKAREDAFAKLKEQQPEIVEIENILVPAGTIEYGQLITEANTDAPGPVLVHLASGPLRGAKLIGSFTATDNYLTLSFNQMVINGVSEAVNAVAMDPNTTLPGIVTEIDRRYFSRIVLPMAAEFVEGLTEAIANSGNTTITIQGQTGTTTTDTSGDKDSGEEIASGIEKAGESFSDIINEEADKIRPMLKIHAGTPIGVLFVEPVIEGRDITPQAAIAPAAAAAP